jgi:hypothetical protein
MLQVTKNGKLKKDYRHIEQEVNTGDIVVPLCYVPGFTTGARYMVQGERSISSFGTTYYRSFFIVSNRGTRREFLTTDERFEIITSPL